MRRILVLILALCLIFTLAACAKDQPAPATTAAPKTEAPATEAPKTEAPATEAPKTEAPVTTEAPATEPDEKAALRGTLTADTYTNEMLELQIAKPKGWIFYTDEQIAQVNNMTAEAMQGSDIAELIGKNGQFMDMMMSDAVGNSLNLIIQPKQALLDLYTDEQIFTLSEETMKAQFSAAGMTVGTFEPKTMQVGGKERMILHLVLSANGMEMDEYQIWFRNEAAYMGILTLALLDGSDPQPILDGISSIN